MICTKIVFQPKNFSGYKSHTTIEESIKESIEDSLDTNPLDSGEPDLIPYRRAMMAAHVTIEVAQKKIIKRPYDAVHWQIIRKHLANFPSLKRKEKKFWKIFSFECASYKDEDETWPNERIYMEAMKEMIRVIEEGSFEFMEAENIEVANLNRGTIQKIRGEGVNAKFVDG